MAGEYLSKGSPVLIEGRLKLDRWEKEGQKHSKLRVVGEKMQMLGSRGGGGGGPSQATATASATTAADQEPAGGPEPPADDIPF